jgi:hypothetical protein
MKKRAVKKRYKKYIIMLANAELPKGFNNISAFMSEIHNLRKHLKINITLRSYREWKEETGMTDDLIKQSKLVNEKVL